MSPCHTAVLSLLSTWMMVATVDGTIPTKPNAWATRDSGFTPAPAPVKLAWSFRQNDCRLGSVSIDTPTPSPGGVPFIIGGAASAGCPQKVNGPGSKTYLNARQGATVTSNAASANNVTTSDTGSAVTDTFVNVGIASPTTPTPSPVAPTTAGFYVEVIFTVQQTFTAGTTYRLLDIAAHGATDNNLADTNSIFQMDYTPASGGTLDTLSFNYRFWRYTAAASTFTSSVDSSTGNLPELVNLGAASVGDTWFLGIASSVTVGTIYLGKLGQAIGTSGTSGAGAIPVYSYYSALKMPSGGVKICLGSTCAGTSISSLKADFHWLGFYGGATATLPPATAISNHCQYGGLPNSNPVGRQTADSYVWIFNPTAAVSFNLNDSASYFDQDGNNPASYEITALATKGTIKSSGNTVTLNEVITSTETVEFIPVSATDFSSAYDGQTTCTTPYATFKYRLSDGICDGIATGTASNCMLPVDVTGTICIKEVNTAPVITGGNLLPTTVDISSTFDLACKDNDVTYSAAGLAKFTIISQSHPALGSITYSASQPCAAGNTAITMPYDILIATPPPTGTSATVTLCYKSNPNTGTVFPTASPASTDVISYSCTDKGGLTAQGSFSVAITDPNPPTLAPTTPTNAPATNAPVMTKSPTAPTPPTTLAPTNVDGSSGITAAPLASDGHMTMVGKLNMVVGILGGMMM